MVVVDRLEEHPNLDEVLGVLARLPHVGDDDLPRLAAAWRNTPAAAEARDKALLPDSPLVIEVLAAFDAVSALFADDLRGEADYVTVDPVVTTTALKAVRDAVAAAYAQPVLSPTEHALLLGPWHEVFPVATVSEPDLGPSAGVVKGLLGALPLLAERCHDGRGRALFDELVDQSWALEPDAASAARDASWQAAVLLSRRRVWTLVRRSATQGLGRPCRSCRRPEEGRDEQRVLTLCLDAACALLVADALPDATTAVLTSPVRSLIPGQRQP